MRKYTYLVATAAFSLSTLAVSPTYSAGFQVSEVSVAGLGRAFAGAGISGESISDMFFNPASLSLREGREMELGLHIISPSASFENNGSTQVYGGALTVPSRGNNSDGGTSAAVPNFFYSAPINESLTYGIGITSPFGLTTEYDSNWVGRYAALKSELITVEINPAIAYRVSPTVSVGVGLTLLKADAELSRAQFTGATTPDALSTVEGDDTAIGWNAGIIVGDENGRFGLGYRSEIDVEPNGELIISPLGIRAGASSEVTLPETFYLSGMKRLNDKFELLGSIRYTDWSSFDELRFKFDNGLPDSVTPENWGSSTTYSIGFNYHADDRLTYRAGIGFDESPVSDEFRTARIPDTDRTWLAVGLSYQASEKTRIDFGFAHIFTDDVPLNETTNLVSTAPGAAVDNLSGTYTDTDANIISFSVSFSL